jgi:hypothetical protein
MTNHTLVDYAIAFSDLNDLPEGLEQIAQTLVDGHYNACRIYHPFGRIVAGLWSLSQDTLSLEGFMQLGDLDDTREGPTALTYDYQTILSDLQQSPSDHTLVIVP